MSERNERYQEYLLSDHWKNLRLLKFKEVGKVCAYCQSNSRIHVHHIRYRNLYDCTTADLIVFCEDHHNSLHKAAEFYKMSLIDMELERACKLLETFAGTQRFMDRQKAIDVKRSQKKQKKSKRSKSPFDFKIRPFKPAPQVNNGCHPQYRQTHPKDRVIAYLNNLKLGTT